ncbi:unnamed protein product [Caenorhabditis brenneri]
MSEEELPKAEKNGENNRENNVPTATADQFLILKHIGSGAYGEVAAVKKLVGNDENEIYAMKAMEKKKMGKNKKMVEHEWKLLTSINNPFFMTMRYSFQTHRHIVFVMPFAGGGDMLTMMEKSCLTEKSAEFYLCELVEGIGYLHENEILHRDVKLENLLVGHDGHLLITDYGLSATSCNSDDAIEGTIGTRHTMAPEIHLKKRYGPACDWWSVGITYCDMRSSKSVFDGDDSVQYSESTVKKRPRIPNCLSPRERSLVNKLIVRDPAQRLGGGVDGTSAIKQHDYFKNVLWQDVILKKLVPPFIPSNEMITNFECFPEHQKGSQFPSFEHPVNLYWENIDYTHPSLI